MSAEYDGDTKMFKEPLKVKIDTMRFWRWQVEQGRKGHGVQGPSRGEFAVAAGIISPDDPSMKEAVKPAVQVQSGPPARYPGYTGRS
jgi:hypothetical protein